MWPRSEQSDRLPAVPHLRLRKLLKKSRPKKDPSDCSRVRVEDDETEDDWVHTAIAFYKGPRFDKDGFVRVFLRGQPGVDTGKFQMPSKIRKESYV